MKCPKCGIRAAKNAISCFCGYEFTGSNSPDRSTTPGAGKNSPAAGVKSPDTEQAGYVNGEHNAASPSPDDSGSGTGEAETRSTETEELRNSPRYDDTVQRYDRVGGWLLLLCVLLTILGPLATIYTIAIVDSQLEGLFEATPGLKTFYNINSILSFALGLFSLWAGFSLWTKMKGAVERAKKYLYARLVYLVILYFLPTMSGLPEEVSAGLQNDIASASFFSFIYVAIWYLYLTKSKRVRGTYPI